MPTDPVATGYDAFFSAAGASPTLKRLWREHASGRDFPDDFYHISFVTLDQLARIARELRLEPGEAFVDVGCGMGGPALWLARETNANLVGVDASAVGVRIAHQRAEQLGLADRARFVTGTFAATTLPDTSANAIVSEDALQYAPDKHAAFTEAHRLLVPGGRLVFTAFELAPERVAATPVLGADPVSDYAPVLERAGFTVDAYEEVPGWPEPVTAAYQSLIDARETLVEEMGELPVNVLMSELTANLQLRPYRRRILAIATKPR